MLRLWWRRLLLLSMVFSQTAILELNFPTDQENLERLQNDEEFQLQVIVRKDALIVASSKDGKLKELPLDATSGYDFAALSGFLRAVKQRVPDKTDITILMEPGIEYQHLVSAMDTSRSYQAVVAANLVDAELFPDVSIGDAPALKGDQG